MQTGQVELKLARRGDARGIALMSRDLIEAGLGWSWTPERVTRQIRGADAVVLTARMGRRLLGFAIMHFREEDAYLNLLAVRPTHRRAGIGRRLIRWLEDSASVAGISAIHLEVRANNRGARAFYAKLGYEEAATVPGYYRGRETAIRMRRRLRTTRWSEFWAHQDDLAPLVSFKKLAD